MVLGGFLLPCNPPCPTFHLPTSLLEMEQNPLHATQDSTDITRALRHTKPPAPPAKLHLELTGQQEFHGYHAVFEV